MQIRKRIVRRMRRSGAGIDVAKDVNAVISANVGERGATTSTSSTRDGARHSGRPAASGAETSETDGA
jgi:hypothetical protein